MKVAENRWMSFVQPVTIGNALPIPSNSRLQFKACPADIKKNRNRLRELSQLLNEIPHTSYEARVENQRDRSESALTKVLQEGDQASGKALAESLSSNGKCHGKEDHPHKLEKR